MKKCYLFCLSMLMLAACSTEGTKVPKGILPIDKMKVVMWDVILAGAHADVLKEKDTALKVLNTGYINKALQIHNLSKEEFFKSFDFYQQRPLLNQVLFDSLNAYAQRQKNDIYVPVK